MQTTEKITALRQIMQQKNLAAWIVPSADPHLSEYLPVYWQARAWLSGFTGSVGTLVILADQATLWVDGRYVEQAQKQVANSGIEVKQLAIGGLAYAQWLAQILPAQSIVGVAPEVLSLQAHASLQATLTKKAIQLQAQADILASIWHDRPSLPATPIYAQDPAWVTEPAKAKLQRLRQALVEKAADYHLISALDDIAWLTNLRGGDVSFNPVFLAHALISAEQAVLFVDETKLSSPLRTSLTEIGFSVQPYTQVASALSQLPNSAKLLLDPAKVTIASIAQVPPTVSLVEDINPSTFFKAQKSPLEISNIKQAMVQDGIALCHFFAELEPLLAKKEALTELDISDMLLAQRQQRKNFVSESFSTIAGFNANAAMPHYRATKDSHAKIQGHGILLIDSGAQYQNGTTDITRVIPVGQANAEQIRDFTLVLKAHIAMSMTIFPENILAPLIDAIARAQLWQQQLDYAHGTGHGVGYFLNVHEGPQVLSYFAPPAARTAMKTGMVTSIEPGLYRPGKWGIRIENLVANVALPSKSEFGQFLTFEPLTYCPIDTRLVAKNLLTPVEIDWLNAYHAQVKAQLSTWLHGNALEWLQLRTMAI